MKPSNRTDTLQTAIGKLLGLYCFDAEKKGNVPSRSNIGFYESDKTILSKIAERVLSTGTITDKQYKYIQQKLPSYQFLTDQFDYTRFSVPEIKVIETENNVVTYRSRKLECSIYDRKSLRLDFGYNSDLIAKVKSISGRKYHRTDKEIYWTVPINARNIQILEDWGFDVPQAVRLLKNKEHKKLNPPVLKKTLRPYQQIGAERLAGVLGLRGLLADEMGLGKTAQALAAVEYLKDTAYPVLVICPSSLKWNWAREAKMWLPDVCVRVLSGYCKRTTWKTKEKEICIINDDILANQTNKYGEIKHKGWISLLGTAGYKTLIVDECHRIKNNRKKTITITNKSTGKESKLKVPACKKSAAVLTLAKITDNFIALSGTPIENRPVEFFPILNALDKDLFPNFWHYVNRYCAAKNNGFGWSYKGASNTKELHTILVNSLMIRRSKKDVLKELPPKIRTVIPVEIDLGEYNKEEREFLSYVQRMNNELAVDIKDSRSEGLARIERLKQAAVVGKLNACIEWIEDYLESERKLVVFAHHRFVLDKLQKHFGDICVRMDGNTPAKERLHVVDSFQTNPKIRLFLGNIKAAGVGITLTAASDTLTLELGWTPGEHDQAEDRCHRIGQEADSVTAYYIIAKGTIEEEIATVLDEKREILKNVMDGKDVGSGELLMELLNHYTQKLEGEE